MPSRDMHDHDGGEEIPAQMPQFEAPSWGTAETPLVDPTSDTVAIVFQIQRGERKMTGGVGAPGTEWDDHPGETLRRMFADILDMMQEDNFLPVRVRYDITIDGDVLHGETRPGV